MKLRLKLAHSLLHLLLLGLILVVDTSHQDLSVVVDLDLLLGMQVLEDQVSTGILLNLFL